MIEDVIVRKDELLTALQENRSKHRQVFEKALEGYRQAAIQTLNDRITKLSAGKLPDLAVRMPLPVDHTRDYDRVIRMLTMHQSDTITLDESTFAMYVEDDWAWRREFI